MNRVKTVAIMVGATALALNGFAQATFVTIGNVGNTDDTTGYGGVAYEYSISAQEVSIAAFVASGAGDGDEGYWNDGTRSVGTGAPAVNVSLYEAMKYCNYLTTGDINSGYYSTLDGGATYQANVLSHDAYAVENGTTYFIPTEDEWVKAAYWTGSGYSLYAGDTGLRRTPAEGGGATGWNYNYVNSDPNYTRKVTQGTSEWNGTVNMMGNVWEWMEDSTGVRRGGCFDSGSIYLQSGYRSTNIDPTDEYFFIGFRPVKVVSTFVSIIGDAGYADNYIGYGDVAYDYKISDHEVSIEEFAASGAGDGDENYWNQGSKTVGTEAPATMVSLYEAMKYCNWRTTGDINSGYYRPRGGGVYQASALSHDAYAAAHGTTFFVPTNDEWHRAAYWTGSDYSDYANGDDVIDGAPMEGGGTTGWNYNYVSPAPNRTRGTALGTMEQNGTFNMMGNVLERTEGPAGILRGGAYYTDLAHFDAANYAYVPPTYESDTCGFRPVVVVSTFVSIGDAGNANDVATDFGGVAYEYKISDHEVTITEFSASGAGDGDEGHWNDGTRTVGLGAPAGNVTLYEAMKYCNWLTTGDVTNGYYSTGDGGVTFQANALSHDAYAAENGITFFIPTEDEWYKAAYWTGGGYSYYANGDNKEDGNPTEGGGATEWNYNAVNAAPNYTRDTALGAIEQNGTVNMMGNVSEWIEDDSGVVRGGSCYTGSAFLSLLYRDSSFIPTMEDPSFGFRPVVVIPELTAPSLMMSGSDVSWQGKSSQNYRLLTTTNLTTTSWAPLTPDWIRGGTNGMMIYTNTSSGDHRYFKVDAWIP